MNTFTDVNGNTVHLNHGVTVKTGNWTVYGPVIKITAGRNGFANLAIRRSNGNTFFASSERIVKAQAR